jgi:hypothetical protein
LSPTNPIWIYWGANPGLRNKRPENNRLSHGTASGSCYFLFPPIKYSLQHSVLKHSQFVFFY